MTVRYVRGTAYSIDIFRVGTQHQMLSMRLCGVSEPRRIHSSQKGRRIFFHISMVWLGTVALRMFMEIGAVACHRFNTCIDVELLAFAVG